jgi:uncharacterized membrane protein YfcA
MDIWESPNFGSYEIWVSGLLIFVGGTLLNGAGLGGGGVFVTILYTIMHMTAHEAIPNSKMIIFMSGIAMFLLHIVRKGKANLIDFEIVRSIIPLSLAGTTLGILINTGVSEAVLLILLCVLMGILVIVSTTIAIRRFRAHKKDKMTNSATDAVSVGKGNHVELQEEDLEQVSTAEKNVDIFNRKNLFLVALLVLVIVCGIIFQSETIHGGIRWTFFGISLSACLGACWFFFIPTAPKVYPFLGLIAGVCSGLFGVGGGMIIAPSLLHMKVDPGVAIAVSATCVLFTSASSAMQYLFIGRVAVWISLFLSIFGVLSSVAGAYAATRINKLTDKPYTTHVIVAGAVMVSAAATLVYTLLAFNNN